MKVKELIDKLSEFSQDLDVYVFEKDHPFGGCFDIQNIYCEAAHYGLTKSGVMLQIRTA